jgi:hypothetical protein
MKYLYQVFGLTKQGYYQRIQRSKQQIEGHIKVLETVCEIRKKHPRCGTRKLMVYLGLGVSMLQRYELYDKTRKKCTAANERFGATAAGSPHER